MKKLSLPAIVIGAITEYLLRRLLAALPIIYALRDILWHELTLDKLGAAILDALDENLKLYYLQIVASLISALVAGYVAARIARRGELVNAALALLPAMAFSIHRMTSDSYAPLNALEILLIAGIFLCALLGGWLRSLQSSRLAHAGNS